MISRSWKPFRVRRCSLSARCSLAAFSFPLAKLTKLTEHTGRFFASRFVLTLAPPPPLLSIGQPSTVAGWSRSCQISIRSSRPAVASSFANECLSVCLSVSVFVSSSGLEVVSGSSSYCLGPQTALIQTEALAGLSKSNPLSLTLPLHFGSLLSPQFTGHADRC